MAGPEYQLEAINKNEITKNEDDALKSINGFLSKKNNYKEAKDAWEKNTDKDIQNIRKTYTNLEKKVKEKQTQVDMTIEANKSSSIYKPNDMLTQVNSSQENVTTAMLKNRGQKLGEVESFNAEDKTVTELSSKITDALKDGSDKEISLIGRSDANKFIWSEQPDSQSQRLLNTHKKLMNDLGNDLSQEQKGILTMPQMPDKKNPEAMSDRLNTVLAQARALKGLSTWKSILPAPDFKKFVNKVSISIAAKQETFVGEDRGVGLLFSSKKAKEDMTTILDPETKKSTIETEKKWYRMYQPITFTYEGGKVFTKLYVTNVQKETSTAAGKSSITIRTPAIRTTAKSSPNSALGMFYQNPNIKNPKPNPTIEENVKSNTKLAPWGSYKKEIISTTTGIDKTTNQPKKITSTTEEISGLAGDVVILPPISYGSLEITDNDNGKSKKDGKFEAPIVKEGVTTNMDWDQPYSNNFAICKGLNEKKPVQSLEQLQNLLPKVPSYS